MSAAPAIAAAPAPLAITYHRRSNILELHWPDGAASALPAALLRRSCRCSSCESGRRRGAPPSPGAVSIERIEGFGVAGLQLFFSDGHQRGVFPWSYLFELAASL